MIRQNSLILGCDIEIHSATKYLCGHHDVMAGLIATNHPQTSKKLAHLINSTGCALAPHDCWLLHRGMKTLAVRLDRQQRNARWIAAVLHSLGFLVRYPGIPGHVGNDIHYAQALGPGAVFSFHPAATDDADTAAQFLAQLKLFSISVSFGCVNSLASLPCRMSHASIPVEVRRARGLDEALVRLCIGIEDVRDLWDDLFQGLKNTDLLQQLPNGLWVATYPRKDHSPHTGVDLQHGWIVSEQQLIEDDLAENLKICP